MSSPEMEKLREWIGGPGHWVHVEKFKILTLIELWMIARDLALASHNPGKPPFQRALNELRRVVEKLG